MMEKQKLLEEGKPIQEEFEEVKSKHKRKVEKAEELKDDLEAELHDKLPDEWFEKTVDDYSEEEREKLDEKMTEKARELGLTEDGAELVESEITIPFFGPAANTIAEGFKEAYLPGQQFIDTGAGGYRRGGYVKEKGKVKDLVEALEEVYELNKEKKELRRKRYNLLDEYAKEVRERAKKKLEEVE